MTHCQDSEVTGHRKGLLFDALFVKGNHGIVVWFLNDKESIGQERRGICVEYGRERLLW